MSHISYSQITYNNIQYDLIYHASNILNHISIYSDNPLTEIKNIKDAKENKVKDIINVYRGTDNKEDYISCGGLYGHGTYGEFSIKEDNYLYADYINLDSISREYIIDLDEIGKKCTWFSDTFTICRDLNFGYNKEFSMEIKNGYLKNISKI